MTTRRHAYTGPYAARQRRLIRWARANPHTARCAKCQRTMAELPAHTTGRAPWWVAGHVVRDDPTSVLQLECSHCSNAEPHRTHAPRARPSEDPYR